MMKTQRTLLTAVAVAVVLTLAGCWDDDDTAETATAPTPTPPAVASVGVPDSAGISTASFVSYILSLVAADESSEPLTIRDTLAVPADESSEPALLT